MKRHSPKSAFVSICVVPSADMGASGSTVGAVSRALWRSDGGATDGRPVEPEASLVGFESLGSVVPLGNLERACIAMAYVVMARWCRWVIWNGQSTRVCHNN